MSLDSEKIYFAKTKDDAIIPSKREEDGAFDIYACFEEDYMIFLPHETQMVPTGIASAFSADYVALLKERGSTGTKGLGQRCGVIDSGFRGTWFVPLTNHNAKPLIIAKSSVPQASIILALKQLNVEEDDYILYPYEKAITQCIMVKVPRLATEEVDYQTLLTFESERGAGALGSSGK